ncbi:DUF4286 family protein [Rhodoferax saidenbachensis]|uniref:Uncharacterized protein n=1 Tax=Rhodoferax saidenbachensis TaxID=1484693 RepID=A0A1P8K753_9BURK|nr:DUF4286 family protein [Rhodoferax saidenbachensis]APW41852.1 hypothetical protein RS694_04370 [Rhodoferax saidenbachensis]
MALLGKGAIAMWWDIASDHRAEFEDWHTHEHFPERMGIPGFHRGSRWAAADGGEGFFVMYELEAYETLVSPGYLARLNAPTPWSSKMMPHHRNMVRSQCRVLESSGGALSRHALTVRISPAEGAADRLQSHLRELAQTLSTRPGTTAGHLLQNQTPKIAPTTEQKIRGGPDPAADWIFIVCGYDLKALQALVTSELSDAALEAAGACAGALRGVYALSHSNTAEDVG